MENRNLKLLSPIVGVMFVMYLSWMSSPFEKSRLKLSDSPTGANQFLNSAQKAAREDDYVLAKQLYQTGVDAGIDESILGLSSEIEETVFPEVRLEQQLLEVELMLSAQPTYIDGLVEKTWLLYQLRLDEEARMSLDSLIKLDPNNEKVEELADLIK